MSGRINPMLRDMRPMIGVGRGGEAPVTPDTKPAWVRNVLSLGAVIFPSLPSAIARRWEAESNTGNIIPDKDTYATKLQASYTARQRANPILPIIRPATATAPFPWPVQRETGPPSDQARKHDFVPVLNNGKLAPFAAAADYAPLDSPYTTAVRSNQDKRRNDLIPIGGGRRMHGLDYGPAPDRIPYARKLGITLMAGPDQFSTQQYYDNIAGTGSTAAGTLVIAPPIWTDPTRGTRSVSGIMQRVQGPGRRRVPAVFVPRQAM